MFGQKENKVRENYPNGTCPDCGYAIPDDAFNGYECKICGHVFYEKNILV